MTTITTATTLPAPACSWPLSLRDMALLSLLTHPQNTVVTLSGTFYWNSPSHSVNSLIVPWQEGHTVWCEKHSVLFVMLTHFGEKSRAWQLQHQRITEFSETLSFQHTDTFFFFDKADLCHKNDFVVMESEIAAATVPNTYFLCSMTQGAPFLDPSAISTGAQLHYRQTRSSLPSQWKSSKFPYKSVDANWYMRGGKA